MTIKLAGIACLPFIGIVIFQPVLRRLALRNASRRPRETVLVILGSLIGTAILTGSFVVGDTLEAALRQGAYQQLGPIDEIVSTPPNRDAATVRDVMSSFRSSDVDGVMPITTLTVSALTTRSPRRASPRSSMIEVDFAQAQSFGRDPGATGLEGLTTPADGHAVITSDLARVLEVSEGDTIEAYAYSTKVPLRIDRIVRKKGIAGFGQGGASRNLFVRPGTIDRLAANAPVEGGFFGIPGVGGAGGGGGGGSGLVGAGGSARPQRLVVVSNTGGVEDGATRSDAVMRKLGDTLNGTGAEARAAKQQVLAQARGFGTVFSAIFTAMGSFGVIAGILLLVNIFVMLAEERRGEMGMLRALGMRRAQLVAAFSTEGWLYAIFAAALGCLAGIGLGNLVANLATSVFASGRGGFRLEPVFAFKSVSVQRGFGLGLLIAVATVVVTSLRTSRFNVIEAIRDITDVPARPNARSFNAAMALTFFGGVALVASFSRTNPFGMLLTPLVVLSGLVMLAVRYVPRRIVFSASALLTIVWGVVGLRFFRSAAGNASIILFVLQGVVLTTGAILLVSQNQEIVGALMKRMMLGRSAMGLRLGLAYPLARRFRTGMTLAMYTLVMFMLTFITVFSHMVFGQIENFSRGATGGFDVVVTSNLTNPVRAEDIQGRKGVKAVAPIYGAFGQFTIPGIAEPRRTLVSAYDERWTAVTPPSLQSRGAYPTDVDAYRAVLADPNLIIVNPGALTGGGGAFGGGGGGRGAQVSASPSPQASPASAGGRAAIPRPRVRIGDTITLGNVFTGASRQVKVAAFAGGGFGGQQGAFYGIKGTRELFGQNLIPTSIYVDTEGVDPDSAAAEISAAFVERGAEASALATQVATAQASILGFFGLLQGYLALGLLVGIAGLGVVMVRAVRERRRQIGVLRALGFSAATIRRAFLIESGFVALEGVLIGVALALVTVYSIVALSSAASSGGGGGGPGFALAFSVPVVRIAVLVLGTLLISLVAVAVPSQTASKIRPAVALRIAD